MGLVSAIWTSRGMNKLLVLVLLGTALLLSNVVVSLCRAGVSHAHTSRDSVVSVCRNKKKGTCSLRFSMHIRHHLWTRHVLVSVLLFPDTARSRWTALTTIFVLRLRLSPVPIYGHGLRIRHRQGQGQDQATAAASFFSPRLVFGVGTCQGVVPLLLLVRLGSVFITKFKSWRLTGTLQRFNPHLMIIRTNVI